MIRFKHPIRLLNRLVPAVALAILGSPAFAADFDVPAQPLPAALRTLGHQAGRPIVFDPADLGARKGVALRGDMSLEGALDILLAGTGLVWRSNDDGSVVVQKAAKSGDETTLSRIEVMGQRAREAYARTDSSVATKTDTPIMETPTKVEVVTQQAIHDMGITSQGLTQVMGALGIAGLGAGDGALDEGFFYRGFQTSTKLWNGFRIETLGVGNVNGGTWFGNVERVDMLRGASAILYGRAEPGGAINITTKKPLEAFGGSVGAGFGDRSNRWLSADVGGPLNEAGTVLYRLNVDHEIEDSSYRYGQDYRSTGFAPALEFRVSPTTTVSLEGMFRHLEGSSNQPYIPIDPSTGRLADVDPDLTLMPGASSEFKQRRVLLGIDHRFNDDWQLSWKYMRNDARQPLNLWSLVVGMYYPLNPGDALTFDRWLTGARSRQTVDASLLELTGKFETGPLRHQVLLGVDYYDTRTREDGISKCFGCENLEYFGPPPFILRNELPLFTNYGRPESRYTLVQNETSLYVQDQIELPHQIHVLVGGRYQRLRERSLYTYGPTDDGGPTGPDGSIDCDDGQGGPCFVEDIPTRLHNFLPRGAILWQPVPAVSLYYSYTENSGASQGLDVNSKPIAPEHATQHELGAKFAPHDGRLLASMALFDLTKTNVITTVNGLVYPVGEVQSKGFELSAQGAITPNWNVLTTYNYARPIVRKFGDVASQSVNAGNFQFIAPEGSKLPYQSEHAFSVLTSYRLPFERWQGWRIGGGYNWFSAPVNDRNSTVKSDDYQVVSAFASYDTKLAGYRTTFQLNVDNLFDQKYLLFQGDFGAQQPGIDPVTGFGNYVGGNWGQRRTVKLGVRVEF